MSLRTLELLREVGLTDSTGSPVDVLGMEEAVLRGKLDYYYTTRANAAEAEVAAERSPDGTFSAFRNSISCGRETERTTAAALVYYRTYVNDPLLKEAEPNQPAMQAHVRSIGLPAMEKVDREAVATALKQIAELTPLIRAGVCNLMPVDLLHRAPDRLPLYASPDGFESAVPEDVRALVRESAFVWEVETTPDASIIHHRTPTKPCRHIYIGFEKDLRRSRTGMIYALSDAKRSWRVKKGKLVPVIRQNFDPDVPPTDESFRIWTAQSINRTVLNRLRDIGYELRLAAGLNAAYVTESEFEGLLIGTETDPSPRTRRNSAVNFLNAIAPFNSNVTPETVAAIRQDKPKLFELFQGNLIHWAAQLKDTDGDFEDRARGLYTKEIAPLVKAINDQFTKAVVQSGSSVVLAGAGVVALAVTKFAATPLSIPLAIGFGALAAAQAVGQAMPSVAEYRQKKKDIAYVWARLAGS